jgi:hypothetical protein
MISATCLLRQLPRSSLPSSASSFLRSPALLPARRPPAAADAVAVAAAPPSAACVAPAPASAPSCSAGFRRCLLLQWPTVIQAQSGHQVLRHSQSRAAPSNGIPAAMFSNQSARRPFSSSSSYRRLPPVDIPDLARPRYACFFNKTVAPPHEPAVSYRQVHLLYDGLCL